MQIIFWFCLNLRLLSFAIGNNQMCIRDRYTITTFRPSLLSFFISESCFNSQYISIDKCVTHIVNNSVLCQILLYQIKYSTYITVNIIYAFWLRYISLNPILAKMSVILQKILLPSKFSSSYENTETNIFTTKQT